jgi:hypothetical protein
MNANFSAPAPPFVDRIYFDQLQSNQATGTDPILTHKVSRTHRDAFINGYYKRFFVEEKELGRGGRGVVLLLRHILDGVDLGMDLDPTDFDGPNSARPICLQKDSYRG